MTRRLPDELFAPLYFETLAHGAFQWPPPKGTDTPHLHLQFRRFAGCPVCNLHLRSFAKSHERLREAGVITVAFFHSSAEQMRPYEGDLPFPTVPDATRRWYRHFGVERSAWAVLHPKVMWSATKGLFSAPSNPFVGGSEQGGLPADFLLRADGTLAAVHYGSHADDQWSVDALLALVSDPKAEAAE
ncbi:MAG: AhpC/TSA family protein [Sandaracinus sp.]|nr:AhpC/TSA family protein [Myxococcales bacterium]MCB9613379.1 AhpC/TSA family protein [Sandaracinus sp.]MCB9636877.1 AhpC/TSA family protein [Sandaracinus sp.]